MAGAGPIPIVERLRAYRSAGVKHARLTICDAAADTITELLEALEDGLALADRNSEDPDWGGRTAEYQASYDRCRAAVAKARGQ